MGMCANITQYTTTYSNGRIGCAKVNAGNTAAPNLQSSVSIRVIISYITPIVNMTMVETMLSSERGQDMHPPLSLSLLVGLEWPAHGSQNTMNIQNVCLGIDMP